MTLRLTCFVSPPIWFDDKANTVTITWSLPSPQALVGDDVGRATGRDLGSWWDRCRPP